MVNGAISVVEEALAEAEGEVIDDFSFLVGEKFLVVPSFGEKAVVWWRHGKDLFFRVLADFRFYLKRMLFTRHLFEIFYSIVLVGDEVESLDF